MSTRRTLTAAERRESRYATQRADAAAAHQNARRACTSCTPDERRTLPLAELEQLHATRTGGTR